MNRRSFIYALLIIVLAACGNLDRSVPTSQPTITLPTRAPQSAAPQGIPVALAPLPTIPADDPRAEGDPNAPVTIIEYSDFQCPFCQRHVLEVYPNIKTQYVDQGQVRYVFRNYIAAEQHRAAPLAAVASLCAAQQNAFWPMHDLLFERQNEWGATGADDPSIFAGYAEELKLDSASFGACQDDPAMLEQVNAETKEAQSLGGDGTPTFFVDDYLVVGAYPLETFQQIIALAQQNAQ